MNYKLLVQNSSGSESWYLPFADFSFSEELNNDRSATIRLDRQCVREIGETYDDTPLYILSHAYRELYIYDEDDNLLYGGYICDMQYNRGSDEEGSMTIASKGFFSLLYKRYTDNLEEYTSTDLADIAWDLISTTQALSYGDFGITRGTHPTCRDAQRTYRYKNIAEAIIGMSSADTENGFDFEVTSSKVFNIYYPWKGSNKKGVVFEDGHNILTYSIRKPFIDAIANQVIVFGDGMGEDDLVETRNADNALKDAFFLLTELLNEKDVKLATTLQEKGDRYLAKNKSPQLAVTITVDYDVITYSDFDLGDFVMVKISDWGIKSLHRVIKRTVQSNGTIYLTLDPTL